jgi:hypothetical protein
MGNRGSTPRPGLAGGTIRYHPTSASATEWRVFMTAILPVWRADGDSFCEERTAVVRLNEVRRSRNAWMDMEVSRIGTRLGTQIAE